MQPSNWCDEQVGKVTAKNFTRRAERFYALSLLRTGRDLDLDETEEYTQLCWGLKYYIERTTPGFFKK